MRREREMVVSGWKLTGPINTPDLRTLPMSPSPTPNELNFLLDDAEGKKVGSAARAGTGRLQS